MDFKIVDAYDHGEEIVRMFTEYTNMLIEGDPKMSRYLDVQNYDEELRNLEYKYGRPWGRLYIAYVDDKPAGCIGLRKLNDEECELKRMFVYPEFRGMRLGETLAHRIIDDATEIGYKRIRLDTLPFLTVAQKMYSKLGFEVTYASESYADSPMDTAIYMKLEL